MVHEYWKRCGRRTGNAVNAGSLRPTSITAAFGLKLIEDRIARDHAGASAVGEVSNAVPGGAAIPRARSRLGLSSAGGGGGGEVDSSLQNVSEFWKVWRLFQRAEASCNVHRSIAL